MNTAIRNPAYSGETGQMLRSKILRYSISGTRFEVNLLHRFSFSLTSFQLDSMRIEPSRSIIASAIVGGGSDDVMPHEDR